MIDSVKISDQAFADYFYSILYGATIEDKLALPNRYQNLLKSEKAAKKFAINSSINEKILVLSYLGIKHFLIISDDNLSKESSLRNVHKKFKNGQEYLSLKSVVDSGLYATSNKQFTEILSIISQGVQSKAYKQELELSRTRYHAKKWDQKLLSGNAESEIEESKEHDHNFVKTMGTVANVVKKSESIFGLHESEIHVLIFLYPLSNKYVSVEQMWNHFVGCLTQKEITYATKSLVESGHAERHPVFKKREYTISANGIKVIHRLKDAVHKLNNFSYA